MLFRHGESHFLRFRAALRRPPPRQGPAPKSARQELEYDILRVLWDGPQDRFGIVFAVQAQCGYRPRPESVEPTLRMLEDGDFVTGREVGARRVYAIAASGSERLADYLEAQSDAAVYSGRRAAPDPTNAHARHDPGDVDGPIVNVG